MPVVGFLLSRLLTDASGCEDAARHVLTITCMLATRSRHATYPDFALSGIPAGAQS